MSKLVFFFTNVLYLSTSKQKMRKLFAYFKLTTNEYFYLSELTFIYDTSYSIKYYILKLQSLPKYSYSTFLAVDHDLGSRSIYFKFNLKTCRAKILKHQLDFAMLRFRKAAQRRFANLLPPTSIRIHFYKSVRLLNISYNIYNLDNLGESGLPCLTPLSTLNACPED